MKLRFFQWTLPAICVLAGCVLLAPLHAVETETKVGANETIKFKQDKAAANMRELEERMFRLAELIRQLQPEDSARLLMSVQRAREQLIAEQMKDASKLLDSLELDQATEEQKEVLKKLEELKNLLLTTDLDLEIKLEQLRKLQEALEKLEGLIGKEVQQFDQAQEMAARKTQDSDQLQNLEAGEKRNQQAGEQIRELTEKIGPQAQPAAQALGQAGQSMSQAASKLGQGKPGSASKNQDQAVKELKEAQQQLADLQQKIREEVGGLVRQMVMNHLKDMLAQQEQVRETTEKLSTRVAEANPQAILAAKRLAPKEDEISALSNKARELVELTQFSMALPYALSALTTQMVLVSGDLQTGRADDKVITDERQIETSIKELIAAMEDAAAPEGEGAGECKGCKGDRNKLLSEVKMLRWMQKTVNTETREIDTRLAADALTDTVKERRIGELESEQNNVRKVAARLHSATCQDCLLGNH